MKKTALLYLIIISSLVYTSCDSTDPKPPTPKPPGYQADIPWPSLEGVPWGVYHGDPQSAGRSKTVGLINGTIQWKHTNPNHRIVPGSIIGPDSLTYTTYEIDGIHAIDLQGKMVWKFAQGGHSASTTPIVTSDNTVYYFTLGGFFALDPSGNVKWHYNQLSKYTEYNNAPNIDKDGNLYFINWLESRLISINPDGEELFSFTSPNFKGGAAITISPDSKTLYIADGNYSTPVLTSFDIQTKTINWDFSKGSLAWNMVDSDGNIYISASDGINKDSCYFISLNPDKTIRWKYAHSSFYRYSNEIVNLLPLPTIDRKGNTYIATDNLMSFDYSGNLRWSIPLSKKVLSPLVCDAENNIYVIEHNSTTEFDLSVFTESGVKILSLPGLTRKAGESPAFGYNRLIVPTEDDSTIYSIK